MLHRRTPGLAGRVHVKPRLLAGRERAGNALVFELRFERVGELELRVRDFEGRALHVAPLVAGRQHVVVMRPAERAAICGSVICTSAGS